MKKINHIPLPLYLLKFIKIEFSMSFNESGELDLKRRMITSMVNDYKTANNYFQDAPEDWPMLHVLSHTSRNDYLYAFVSATKKRFIDGLVDFIFVRDGIISHSAAVREYMEKYQIYESDYSFSNMYKNWQRSAKYAYLKSIKEHNENLKACG